MVGLEAATCGGGWADSRWVDGESVRNWDSECSLDLGSFQHEALCLKSLFKIFKLGTSI